MSITAQTTEKVIQQHLNAFVLDLGVETLLADYDEHAVFITPDKVFRGKQAIRNFFEGFIAALPDNARDNFNLHSSTTDNDIAYILWSVPGHVPLGTDTFVVRNNKIVYQTFAMYSAA